ncbi:hypothetical protein DMENIID0001_057720 [Sergentomyia squamirostris]
MDSGSSGKTNSELIVINEGVINGDSWPESLRTQWISCKQIPSIRTKLEGIEKCLSLSTSHLFNLSGPSVFRFELQESERDRVSEQNKRMV